MPFESNLNNDGQCMSNVYIVMYTVYFVMFYTIHKVKRAQESLFFIRSVCTDRDFNFQIGVVIIIVISRGNSLRVNRVRFFKTETHISPSSLRGYLGRL